MGEIGESRSNETGNHVKELLIIIKLFSNFIWFNYKSILFFISPNDIGTVSIF